MSTAGSAAALFADSKKVCGIYVLEFADGMRYVGQTRQIVSRYAAHRRHHGDIVAFSFAPCSATDLDEHERQEVRRQEAAKRSLRNLNLTGWPAGTGDLDVTVENGRSVFLPWERNRRLRLSDEGEATLHRRFWTLAARDDYEEMAEAVARYIEECIPDPFGTQRLLWTIVALPETGRTKVARRLFTLSCGALETLYAYQVDDGDHARLEIALNFDDARAAEVRGARGRRTALPSVFSNLHHAPSYTSATVHQCVVTSWKDLQRTLDFEPFVEAIYKLNTMQMRRRSSPFKRHHNMALADDLLRRAAIRSDGT
ncbi:GIY-YIG nuclease family protein [Clavibacter michiganensis]|uniref:GIY-YIG nuclease family protein n=1 Tax=Clavibacter michiganensis TaxID=28447 RepID=UPI003EBF888F